MHSDPFGSASGPGAWRENISPAYREAEVTGLERKTCCKGPLPSRLRTRPPERTSPGTPCRTDGRRCTASSPRTRTRRSSSCTRWADRPAIAASTRSQLPPRRRGTGSRPPKPGRVPPAPPLRPLPDSRPIRKTFVVSSASPTWAMQGLLMAIAKDAFQSLPWRSCTIFLHQFSQWTTKRLKTTIPFDTVPHSFGVLAGNLHAMEEKRWFNEVPYLALHPCTFLKFPFTHNSKFTFRFHWGKKIWKTLGQWHLCHFHIVLQSWNKIIIMRFKCRLSALIWEFLHHNGWIMSESESQPFLLGVQMQLDCIKFPSCIKELAKG